MANLPSTWTPKRNSTGRSGVGVWVIAPPTADVASWHPCDEDNTDSLEDVLAASDPDPTRDEASAPPRLAYQTSVGLGPRLNSARSMGNELLQVQAWKLNTPAKALTKNGPSKSVGLSGCLFTLEFALLFPSPARQHL